MKKVIVSVLLACACSLGVRAQMGQVEMPDSLVRELEEVVVKADRSVTRLEGTSLVSTIAGTNLENVGNAVDVLRQLPMISVRDNAVEIAGKGAPEIFIDGRPMRDDRELQSLQSDNIRRVELVLAPGAQYDSSTRAVLKIFTRRKFVRGLSVRDEVNADWRRRTSVNDVLDMSWHGSKLELFATGAYAHNNSLIKGLTVNRWVHQGKQMTVGSTQRNNYPVNIGQGKVGFNYVSGVHSFGGYYRYLSEHADYSNHGSEWVDGEEPVIRNIDWEIVGRSHLASVYYDCRLSKRDVHLHFDGTFRRSDSDNHSLTSYPEGMLSDVGSVQDKRSWLYAGKFYAELPLWRGVLTAGTQDSYTSTSLGYVMENEEVGSYIPSSHSDAAQTSVAAFASWNRVLGKWNVTAGVRWEYVDYRYTLNGKRDDEISRRDHLVTPDVAIGYSPVDDVEMTLSYKVSTVRPPYAQLTSGLTYVGRHEIEGGNPALRDERMHDVQLFGRWRDFMLQADYVRSIDTYAFVKRPYDAPTPQLLMQPVNVDVSGLYAYLIWSRQVKRWTPNVTVGCNAQWLELGGERYNRPMWTYSFRNTLELPHGWTITADVSGRSGGDMQTNRFASSWFGMNAGVCKRFLNKALTLKLDVTDIFNTECNDWSMHTYNVDMRKTQSYDRRGISLSVAYQFQPKKSRYKGGVASQSELNRM